MKLNIVKTAALGLSLGILASGGAYAVHERMQSQNLYLYGDVQADATAFSIIMTANDGSVFKKLDVYALSPGGSVLVGNEIAYALEHSKSHVTYHVGSMAASMAAMLVCYSPNIDISDRANLLFHMPFDEGPNGEKIPLDLNDPLEKNIHNQALAGMAKCKFLTKDELTRIANGEDFWITGKVINERIRASETVLDKVEKLIKSLVY